MYREHVIEAELQKFRQVHPVPVHLASWQVGRVLDCIHGELFNSRLTVQMLKARCCIRDNNVSCRFKHEIGVSIREYIETLRLQAARGLLQGGGCSAAEAAHAVGYINLQTFYRAFARTYQCTPGSIRGASREQRPSLAEST